MAVDGMTDEAVRRLLLETRRIAVVGASDKPGRASGGVFRFLLDRGYDAVPVNPLLAGKTLHGVSVVSSLEEASPLEMVDIFRRSEDAGDVVDEAIAAGAKAVWLQLGVVDQQAADRARAAGLVCVMDRCPAIEWRRLHLPEHLDASRA